jgi:hypothetical protein
LIHIYTLSQFLFCFPSHEQPEVRQLFKSQGRLQPFFDENGIKTPQIGCFAAQVGKWPHGWIYARTD